MVQVIRVCNWEQYEVDENGNAWGNGLNSAGEEKVLRPTPLPFAKHPVCGCGLTMPEERREMLGMVGPRNILMVEGFYWRLVQIAGSNRESAYRGWIVTAKSEAMNEALIADRCMLDLEQVTYSLAVLKSLELIEYVECEFAKECVQPVRFDVSFDGENVNLDKVEAPQISSEKPRETASPSRTNINTKDNINIKIKIKEEAEGRCAQGEDVGIKESVCLISSTAEESESGSESKESGSKERKESRSEESRSKESKESKESASSRGNQSLKEAIPGAEPNGGVLPGGGHAPNGSINWYLEIERLKQHSNLKVISPECLLEGIDPKKEYAKIRLIERMMIWFKAICPFSLEPEEVGSTQARIQVNSDVGACKGWASDAWDKNGPDGVIAIMVFMQEICVKWDKNNHGGIDSPMGVWIAMVKKQLGVIAKIGKGLENVG